MIEPLNILDVDELCHTISDLGRIESDLPEDDTETRTLIRNAVSVIENELNNDKPDIEMCLLNIEQIKLFLSDLEPIIGKRTTEELSSCQLVLVNLLAKLNAMSDFFVIGARESGKVHSRICFSLVEANHYVKLMMQNASSKVYVVHVEQYGARTEVEAYTRQEIVDTPNGPELISKIN